MVDGMKSGVEVEKTEVRALEEGMMTVGAVIPNVWGAAVKSVQEGKEAAGVAMPGASGEKMWLGV